MTQEEREVIKKLELCDFSHMHQYYLEEAAKRKNRTKEEKEVSFNSQPALPLRFPLIPPNKNAHSSIFKT